MVSRRATSLRLRPSSPSKVKVSATGSGSEMPVDSMTNWSKRPSLARRSTSSRRSSRKVQQMQPLLISTSFSSVRDSSAPPSRISAASMFTSLMSLTITATRRPSRLFRIWLSRVVLPAPRKPESTVTGSRAASLVWGTGVLIGRPHDKGWCACVRLCSVLACITASTGGAFTVQLDDRAAQRKHVLFHPVPQGLVQVRYVELIDMAAAVADGERSETCFALA
ncbi:hypothetical protein D3C76_657150 [compost metagenome]